MTRSRRAPANADVYEAGDAHAGARLEERVAQGQRRHGAGERHLPVDQEPGVRQGDPRAGAELDFGGPARSDHELRIDRGERSPVPAREAVVPDLQPDPVGVRPRRPEPEAEPRPVLQDRGRVERLVGRVAEPQRAAGVRPDRQLVPVSQRPRRLLGPGRGPHHPQACRKQDPPVHRTSRGRNARAPRGRPGGSTGNCGNRKRGPSRPTEQAWRLR